MNPKQHTVTIPMDDYHELVDVANGNKFRERCQFLIERLSELERRTGSLPRGLTLHEVIDTIKKEIQK